MEKREDYGQLELFGQTKENKLTKTHTSKAFIVYISKYEKALLIILGFVIMGIISFSLGVERGKRLATFKPDFRLDIATKPRETSPGATAGQLTKQQPIVGSNQYKPLKEESTEYIQNFTIQVASFSSRQNAQKEADFLKKKGLTALVVPKGKFNMVCVGNFAKIEEAQILLSKLKKQYQDCRIRRL